MPEHALTDEETHALYRTLQYAVGTNLGEISRGNLSQNGIVRLVQPHVEALLSRIVQRRNGELVRLTAPEVDAYAAPPPRRDA